jgi:hypothetical protein
MLRGGPAGLPGDVISLPLYHAPRGLADAIARRARAQFIGDLTEFGLPVPSEGPFSLLARIGHVPSLVDPGVIDVIRDGSIEVVATVDALDADQRRNTRRPRAVVPRVPGAAVADRLRGQAVTATGQDDREGLAE